MDEPRETPQSPSEGRKPVLHLAAGILALLGILAGGTTLWFSRTDEVSFGWAAYAPLSDEVFFPGMFMLSPTQATGLALLALGLICAAFWAGLRLGTRTTL